MLYSLIFGDSTNNNIGSAFFNGYLAFVSFRGLLMVKRDKEYKQLGIVIPFLYLTSVLFLLVAFENITFPIIFNDETAAQLHILTAGLISFLIAIVSLGFILIKRNEVTKSAKLPISTQFAHKFSLTKREQEIIPMLIQGKTNKEIGEILYISMRTVDTHIYNIYRKCSVKNKLELAHLISSYS